MGIFLVVCLLALIAALAVYEIDKAQDEEAKIRSELIATAEAYAKPRISPHNISVSIYEVDGHVHVWNCSFNLPTQIGPQFRAFTSPAEKRKYDRARAKLEQKIAIAIARMDIEL